MLKKKIQFQCVGVPYNYPAIISYIDTLVNNGYKVAICEQMEDAKQTEGSG